MPGVEARAPRIAVLVKRFPRLSETFILNEFLELRRQGAPVDLFAIMDPAEARSHPEALALMPEVDYLQPGSRWRLLPAVLRTARRHPWGTLRSFGWMLTRHSAPSTRNWLHAMVLVEHLHTRGATHLHSHFLHSPASLAFIAKKISGQRYSLSGHAKDIYTTLPDNVVMRCRAAEFVTTCTAANRDHLLELGVPASKVYLCRHGVDLQRFTAAGRRPHAGRIVSVGRLVPKKGFDVLVQACGELHRRGIDFDLRIIGGGELRDELGNLAAREGIGERVSLPGSMDQAELVGELAQAELFALTPRVMPDGDRDGIPNVLLEAMAAGVPVVASAVSGIPELIADTATGRLVAAARPDLLADVLEELLRDREERDRLAAAALRFVTETRSWSSAVTPLRELLAQALAVDSTPPAPAPIGGPAEATIA